MKGWIKLHRSLIDWEWYSDRNAVLLLVHLLISVNHEDKKWRGILIKAGSMVLSWQTLAEGSKMSVRQCRTAMDKLVNSGEVTRSVTNRFQVIVLLKWEKMQSNDKQVTRKLTGRGQTDDKQVTTTKEYNKESKELKEVRKEFKNSIQPFLKTYGKDLLNEFYSYWTEKKPKGRKMRFELERVFDVKKRLARWEKNDYGKEDKAQEKRKKVSTALTDQEQDQKKREYDIRLAEKSFVSYENGDSFHQDDIWIHGFLQSIGVKMPKRKHKDDSIQCYYLGLMQSGKRIIDLL